MSKRDAIIQTGRFLRSLSYTFPGSLFDSLIHCGRSVCTSNFGEDLVLTRMFTLPSTGFYVDIGANHPIIGSNTFRLELLGWRGLAIEPNPDLARKYPRVRPRCTIVSCGVGIEGGQFEYIRFDLNQCNTFDREMAELAKKRGAHELNRTVVEILPLSSILADNVGDQHIDVMSIDIEGYDFQAIASNNWDRWRPSILLIEDHVPTGLSFESSKIASFLRERGYIIVSRVHFTSFFVRLDHVEKLAW